MGWLRTPPSQNPVLQYVKKHPMTAQNQHITSKFIETRLFRKMKPIKTVDYSNHQTVSILVNSKNEIIFRLNKK